MIFYHGTNDPEAYYEILKHGLKGGFNENGTHGEWEEPTLFLAENPQDAKRYGFVLEVDLELVKLDKYINFKVSYQAKDCNPDYYFYYLTDQAGNQCLVAEPLVEDWLSIENDIIIPEKLIQESEY